jgi:cell shape-determining protein MreC
MLQSVSLIVDSVGKLSSFSAFVVLSFILLIFVFAISIVIVKMNSSLVSVLIKSLNELRIEIGMTREELVKHVTKTETDVFQLKEQIAEVAELRERLLSLEEQAGIRSENE